MAELWAPVYPGGSVYDEREAEAASRVIRAKSPFRWYGIDLQHETEQFEREMASYLGVKHAVAVGSGSTALTVAMAALGIGPGMEVILPSLLWISDVNSVVWLGAVPVFCECDDTWNMDPDDLERRITERTRLIDAIHMCGSAADIERIVKIGEKHGIPVLEDCSQAAGTTVSGRQIGSFGTVATFSLQYNKNFTTGEGGVIAMNDPDLKKACEALADVGFERDEDGVSQPKDSPFESYGVGCRMDEIRAAVGRVQLSKLDSICERMRAHRNELQERLSSVKSVRWRRLIDPEGDSGSNLCWMHDTAEQAQSLVSRLAERGYPVSNAPGGVHQMRYMSNLRAKKPLTTGGPWTHPLNSGIEADYSPDTVPQSNNMFDRGGNICVPPVLTREQKEGFVKAFREEAE